MAIFNLHSYFSHTLKLYNYRACQNSVFIDFVTECLLQWELALEIVYQKVTLYENLKELASYFNFISFLQTGLCCNSRLFKISLPFIILKDQNRFLERRYIGDCARLVYDLMQYEHNNLIWQLMLVDFQKAFDSVSWSFLNRVLKKEFLFLLITIIIKWHSLLVILLYFLMEVRTLEAALSTLEIFGSLSGLKINMDKTKIVEIG